MAAERPPVNISESPELRFVQLPEFNKRDGISLEAFNKNKIAWLQANLDKFEQERKTYYRELYFQLTVLGIALPYSFHLKTLMEPPPDTLFSMRLNRFKEISPEVMTLRQAVYGKEASRQAALQSTLQLPLNPDENQFFLPRSNIGTYSNIIEEGYNRANFENALRMLTSDESIFPLGSLNKKFKSLDVSARSIDEFRQLSAISETGELFKNVFDKHPRIPREMHDRFLWLVSFLTQHKQTPHAIAQAKNLQKKNVSFTEVENYLRNFYNKNVAEELLTRIKAAYNLKLAVYRIAEFSDLDDKLQEGEKNFMLALLEAHTQGASNLNLIATSDERRYEQYKFGYEMMRANHFLMQNPLAFHTNISLYGHEKLEDNERPVFDIANIRNLETALTALIMQQKNVAEEAGFNPEKIKHFFEYLKSTHTSIESWVTSRNNGFLEILNKLDELKSNPKTERYDKAKAQDFKRKISGMFYLKLALENRDLFKENLSRLSESDRNLFLVVLESHATGRPIVLFDNKDPVAAERFRLAYQMVGENIDAILPIDVAVLQDDNGIPLTKLTTNPTVLMSEPQAFFQRLGELQAAENKKREDHLNVFNTEYRDAIKPSPAITVTQTPANLFYRPSAAAKPIFFSTSLELDSTQNIQEQVAAQGGSWTKALPDGIAMVAISGVKDVWSITDVLSSDEVIRIDFTGNVPEQEWLIKATSIINTLEPPISISEDLYPTDCAKQMILFCLAQNLEFVVEEDFAAKLQSVFLNFPSEQDVNKVQVFLKQVADNFPDQALDSLNEANLRSVDTNSQPMHTKPTR